MGSSSLTLNLSAKTKPTPRRGGTVAGGDPPIRKSTTKGKKSAEAWTSGSEHGDGGSHGGTAKGAEKPPNAPPAGQKNSPLDPKVNAANAKREVGFLPFNVFAEYTRRRIAVPQVMLREEIKAIQAKYQFPSGKVSILSGYELMMDRKYSWPCLSSDDLNTLSSGPDPAHAGMGPCFVFLIVECIWVDKQEGENVRRIWVVVQFHREKKLAIAWDLCPTADVRKRVLQWALDPSSAFAGYKPFTRNCVPPAIPIYEWWYTGPSQLCTLQYWLEVYKRSGCRKEFTKDLPSCPSGIQFLKPSQ